MRGGQARGCQRFERGLESVDLACRQRGVPRCLQVRPGAREMHTGHVREGLDGGHRLVGRQTVAAQPGLDPDVDVQVAETAPRFPPRAGVRRQATGPDQRVTGRDRDAGPGGLHDAIRGDREEDQDGGPDARRPELERLVQRRDADAVRAGGQRGVSDGHGAVAVPIGLDDSVHERSGGQPADDHPDVAGESAQVDLQPCRARQDRQAGGPEARLDRLPCAAHPAGRPKPRRPAPARRAASAASRLRARAISNGRSPARSPESPTRCRTASPAIP